MQFRGAYVRIGAVQWLVRVGLALVANAVALIVAASLLPRFDIDATAFVVALVVFTAASIVVRPLVASLVERHARSFAGVASLISAYVILLVTDLLSDGIQIEGVGTWILATVIVWLATLVYEAVDERLELRIAGALPRSGTSRTGS